MFRRAIWDKLPNFWKFWNCLSKKRAISKFSKIIWVIYPKNCSNQITGNYKTAGNYKITPLTMVKAQWWSNVLVVKVLDSQSRGPVAPRLTQPFILPRSIKWVAGISRNLVVRSKLPPQSGPSLEAVEPHPWKRVIKFFCFFLLQCWLQSSMWLYA